MAQLIPGAYGGRDEKREEGRMIEEKMFRKCVCDVCKCEFTITGDIWFPFSEENFKEDLKERGWTFDEQNLSFCPEHSNKKTRMRKERRKG